MKPFFNGTSSTVVAVDKDLKKLTAAEGGIAGSYLNTVASHGEANIQSEHSSKGLPLPKRRDQEKCHQSLDEGQYKETDKGDSSCHTEATCLVPNRASSV